MFKDLDFILNNLEGLNKKIFFLFILTIFGTILETLSIGLIFPLLKIILEGSDILKLSGTSFQFIEDFKSILLNLSYEKLILLFLFFILTVFFLKTIFFIFFVWTQNKFAYEVESLIGKKLLKYYFNQNYNFHLNKNSSELLRNIVDEIKIFRVNIINSFLILLVEIMIVLFISGLLIYIVSFETILIILFIFLIVIFYSKLNKSKIISLGAHRQNEDALRIRHLKQGLDGIKEIKISGNENEFLKLFDKHNKKSVKAKAEQQFWVGIPRHIIESVGVLAFVLITVYAIMSGVEVKSYLPVLGLFGAAAFKLLPSASKIIQSINNIRYGGPSLTLLAEEIKQINIQDKKKIKINEKISIINFESLQFNEVDFKYANSTSLVLKKINMNINKGDKIAISGISGSGKSTLVDLISGLAEPSNGKILLNNKIVNLNDKNWLNQVGYVPQKTFLTDDTVEKNITFGEKELLFNNSKLKEIISLVELDEFLENDRKKLKLNVGEFGDRLSGGQRQRIGIARALYSKFQILILDEATSALDFKTESKVLENICNYMKEKTLIIISHRSSSFKSCNKIYEIKDGVLSLNK